LDANLNNSFGAPPQLPEHQLHVLKVAEDESDPFKVALLYRDSVQFWDPAGGYQGPERTFKNPGGTNGIWTFDILGNDMLITTGNVNQYCTDVSEFHIFDLTTNKTKVSHKFANMESFDCAVLVDNTKALIGVHRDDESLVVYDIVKGFVSQRWKTPKGHFNKQLIRDPLDPNIFIGLTYFTKQIHIWDIRQKGNAPARSIESTVSHDQDLIAKRILKPRHGWQQNVFYTSSPKELSVYDIGTGRAMKKISSGSGPTFRGIAAYGNAVVCSLDGKDELWCWDLNESNLNEPVQKLNCESGHVIAMNGSEVFIHGARWRMYRAVYD